MHLVASSAKHVHINIAHTKVASIKQVFFFNETVPPKKNRAKIWKKAACTIKTYFEVDFTHVLRMRSVTFLGISVFVSLFAYNRYEDLNEYKIDKMIEKIKLELICIIEHISFFILE